MNPIRLSREWPDFFAEAVRRGLKSWELARLIAYIEERVDACEKVKLDTLAALEQALREREKETGGGRIVFPVDGAGQRKEPE